MMLMPVKTSSVFKSRWKALLWAGGVLFFAYTIGGSMKASDPKDGNSATDTADNSEAPQKIPAHWN